MDIYNLFTESLISSLPIYVIVLAGIFFLRDVMRKYFEMKQKYDYKEDRYRQDIEVELAKLNEKIQINDERFKSVNHLILDGDDINNKVLKQFGVTGVDAKVKPNTAFVLTPFNDRYSEDYNWVKSFFVENDYKCTRGDDVKVMNNILGHIIRRMVTAEIVVANISGRNPNVFYELGIAHALGKKVIIIARAPEDITFDISGSQVVLYNDEDTLKRGLNKWLITILKGEKSN